MLAPAVAALQVSAQLLSGPAESMPDVIHFVIS
jgi:hypothetical protein